MTLPAIIIAGEDTPRPAEPAAPPPAPAEPAPESSKPGPATATKPAPAKPSIDQLPPYRVLLHNDDVNDIPHVVQTLTELTPLNRTRALEVTLETDAHGLGLILITHKERAELYEQQFRSKNLTVTIEPAI